MSGEGMASLAKSQDSQPDQATQTSGPSRAENDAAVADQLARLSNEQKAAIILQVLGPEDASDIVARFDERDFRLFARGMIGIGGVSQAVAHGVIRDFLFKLGGGDGICGGTHELRNFLSKFLSTDVVEQILEDLRGPVGRTIWEKLSNCPDEQLAAFLEAEQPQMAALILSKLKSEKAAAVLSQIDIEKAKKIVQRLSRVAFVDPVVLDTVKSAVGRDFLNSAKRRRSAKKPEEIIGSIMNNLPIAATDEILESIRERDEAFAEMVKSAMFTFRDIAVRLDGKGAQALMKEVDSATLALALKLAKEQAPEVVELFTSNMPKRALEQLEEEIEELGKVRAKDAEEAQQTIVRTAQDLARNGAITLLEPGQGDDQLI